MDKADPQKDQDNCQNFEALPQRDQLMYIILKNGQAVPQKDQSDSKKDPLVLRQTELFLRKIKLFIKNSKLITKLSLIIENTSHNDKVDH